MPLTDAMATFLGLSLGVWRLLGWTDLLLHSTSFPRGVNTVVDCP